VDTDQAKKHENELPARAESCWQLSVLYNQSRGECLPGWLHERQLLHPPPAAARPAQDQNAAGDTPTE
jgi:hypothetical protein